MSPLSFIPYEPIVDPSFWHKLTQIKLEVDKLSEAPRKIAGYTLDQHVLTTVVDYTSFNDFEKLQGKIGSSESTSLKTLCSPKYKIRIPLGAIGGVLLNFNSLAAFKDADKNQLLEQQGAEVKNAISTGTAVDDPTLVNKFIVITYADLKNYNFVFWFGYPALANFTYNLINSPKLLRDVFSDSQIESLLQSHSQLKFPNLEVFCVVHSTNLECKTLRYYIDHIDDQSTYLCMIDGSPENFTPGWACRNVLSLIAQHKKSNKIFKTIFLRLGSNFLTSFVTELDITGSENEYKFVGWARNNRGKFGPRSVNLRETIDPLSLAHSSVDLNLKLMKWRLVPQLDLDVVKNQKVLLVGAGTLGCSVARNLMGWGVRHITFLDDGQVSFSNPVRQSLYGYEDCDLGEGAKKKASAAPAALKKILPSMVAEGVVLSVPMPGHSTEGLKEADILHNLIDQHDIIFLLTDSRESRWLPTVIATSLNKLVITAALGFDKYLVMRHGVMSPKTNSKLGCYFCNDITAPGNSKTDRTLDQQCTVTRPGVSNMAAALAVELLVSILQHPAGPLCSSDDETILGLVPHSIRGFLYQFNQILPSTTAFNQCIACSPTVLSEYQNNKEDFLKKVFGSAKYLEDLTGLTELHQSSQIDDILELSDGSASEMD